MHVVVYSVDLHHSARSWKLSTGNEVIAKFNIPADDTNAFAPWLNYVPWKMPDVRSRYALYTNMRWFIYCMLYLMYECSAAFTIRSVSLPLITLFSHDSLTKIRPLPLISVRLLFILYCYNLQTRCISLVLKFQTTLSTYMVMGPPGNLLMRSYYSTLPSKINLWEGKLIITSGPSRWIYVLLLESSKLVIQLLKAMEHRFIYELFSGSACDTMGSALFTPLFWFWYDRLC